MNPNNELSFLDNVMELDAGEIVYFDAILKEWRPLVEGR